MLQHLKQAKQKRREAAARKAYANGYNFDYIYAHGIWNDNNPNIPKSGPGSSLENTHEVIKLLDGFVDHNAIKTIADIGCGDLTWMPDTRFFNNPRISYTGLDIVKDLIDKHNATHACAHREFIHQNLIDWRPTATYDLIIVRDVIFHLFLEDIKTLFVNLKHHFTFIAITSCRNSHNTDRPHHNIAHCAYRNLAKPPFCITAKPLAKCSENTFNRDFLIFCHADFYQ